MTINYQTGQTQAVITPPSNKIKRNLFGPLNHDLLAKDLNDMWKDTIDRQMNKWNFDFNHLCPLEPGRYEWSSEADSSGDDGSVGGGVPEFYRLSNKTKSSNLNPNLFTTVTLSPSSSSCSSSRSVSPTQTPVKFNMQLRDKCRGTSPREDLMCGQRRRLYTKRAPKRCNTATPSTSTSTNGLILTYSENRKDTLRSAVSPRTSRKTSPVTQVFKQQSLLDMLKQRKRRTIDETTNDCKSHNNPKILPIECTTPIKTITNNLVET